MPAPDWTRVDAGIFHHFHTAWIDTISRQLNQLLPENYYALAEQIAGGMGPDVLALEHVESEVPVREPGRSGVRLATRPPQVKFHLTAELEQYASQSKRVAIRHASGHRLIAVVEIVSPGNKGSRHAMSSFVNELLEFLRSGVHLLVIDLFPPTARDPQGMHKRIWDEVVDSDFALPSETPLTMAAYRADSFPEAFVEPIAVGQPLPEMPVFIAADTYIPLPLESCYGAAWEAVPAYWQRIVAGS